MAELIVVRHGQAAFGTEDYDRLTALGTRQAEHLGEWLARRGRIVDAVFAGSLLRHHQTMQAAVAALPNAKALLAAAEICPALDEYHPEAIVAAYGGEVMVPHQAAEARHPEVVRQHFRMLREALLAWAEARTEPQGMAPFARFQADAFAVLDRARDRTQHTALIFTSGGPIGAIVARALDAPPRTAVELNLRIRNASVTEFTSSERHHLLLFNSVAHLEHGDDLLSFA